MHHFPPVRMLECSIAIGRFAKEEEDNVRLEHVS